MDYPGIRKVFKVSGSGVYKGCMWCDIKVMKKDYIKAYLNRSKIMLLYYLITTYTQYYSCFKAKLKTCMKQENLIVAIFSKY